MDLFDYFEMKKRELIDLRDLSEKIGCSLAYMRLVASRNATPSFALCQEIERYTAGLISAIDLYKNSRRAAVDKNIEKEKCPIPMYNGHYKKRVMRKRKNYNSKNEPNPTQEKAPQDPPEDEPKNFLENSLK